MPRGVPKKKSMELPVAEPTVETPAESPPVEVSEVAATEVVVHEKPNGEQQLTDKDRIPSLRSQGFTVHKIDNDKLLGNKGTPRFNGSIVRFDGKLLMGYRYYNPLDEGKTQIAIAELDETYTPVANTHVNIIGHGSTRIFEDCRLFVHNEKLFMSFAEIDIINYPSFKVIQRLVMLGKSLSQAKDFRIKTGRNYKSVEKNWSYFSDNGKLKCIYDIPTETVFEVDEVTGDARNVRTGAPVIWPDGHLRGGTPLIPMEGGGYIGFHHTGTEHEWLLRRYGMGAYTANGNGQVTAISKSFIYGTKNEEYCGSGNPHCIFPVGVVDDGDRYLVSCGVNDTFNAIVEVPKAFLTDLLKPKSYWREDHGRCWRIKGRPVVKTLFGAEHVGKLIKVSGVSGHEYIYKTCDEYAIASLEKCAAATEITLSEYSQAESQIATRNYSNAIPEYLKKNRK